MHLHIDGQHIVQNVFWGVVTNPNGWHTVLGVPAGSKPPFGRTPQNHGFFTPKLFHRIARKLHGHFPLIVHNATHFSVHCGTNSATIKTNVCVLAFRTMGVTAHLMGMQDWFSNELCCWFLGKTIQNYVANTTRVVDIYIHGLHPPTHECKRE